MSKLGNNIRTARKAKGYTMKQLGEIVGSSESAISYYENDRREPSYEILLKISEALDTTIGALLDFEEETNDPSSSTAQYTTKEANIIKKYRALDEHGKKLVDTIINIESERFEKSAPIVELHPKKIIPLFESSFAAGWGDPSFGNPWTDYEVPEESKAEFAIRINGDSMEPQLKDGSIALCQKRPPKDGEVGAFLLDGSYICKQVCMDITGTVHLFSLNRARKNMDQHIAADEIANRLMCFGTVMIKRQPLPII
jgi:transcriptional regulator with XRE-family HTH domain